MTASDSDSDSDSDRTPDVEPAVGPDERTEQVATYVTPAVKEQLQNEARREGVALSKYVRGLLERARLEDTQEQIARDLNAEERLLELIAEGKDEIAAMTEQVHQQNEDVRDLLAKSGSYSVVNFQLLKAAHSPSETQVSHWFETASGRLDADLAGDVNANADHTSPSGGDAVDETGDGGGTDRDDDTADTDSDAAAFVDDLS